MDTLSKADEAMTAAANGTPNEALSNLLSPGSEGSASFSKLNFFVVFRPFKLFRRLQGGPTGFYTGNGSILYDVCEKSY